MVRILILAFIVFFQSCINDDATEITTPENQELKVIYTTVDDGDVGQVAREKYLYNDQYWRSDLKVIFNNPINFSKSIKSIKVTIGEQELNIYNDISAFWVDLDFRNINSINKPVVISLDTGITDVYGNKLKKFKQIKFIPEPFFRLTGVIGSDIYWYNSEFSGLVNDLDSLQEIPDSLNFSIDNIRIHFNSDCDSSITQFPLEASINLPVICMVNQYVLNREAIFNQGISSFEELLEPNKTYTITIPKETTDKFGNPLKHKYQIKFKTQNRFEMPPEQI